MEQATHFVDLMRYLAGGDIVQESIQAVAVGPDMPLKEMPAHPQAEHLVSLTDVAHDYGGRNQKDISCMLVGM